MQAKSFPGTLDALQGIREYAAAAAKHAGLSKQASYGLCLAVDEIATNIVQHGYEERGLTGALDIRAEIEEQRLIVTLEDEGTPYDPRQQPMPDQDDLTSPLESRPVGGLGVFLAMHNVDELTYERAGQRNRTVFVIRRAAKAALPESERAP